MPTAANRVEEPTVRAKLPILVLPFVAQRPFGRLKGRPLCKLLWGRLHGPAWIWASTIYIVLEYLKLPRARLAPVAQCVRRQGGPQQADGAISPGTSAILPTNSDSSRHVGGPLFLCPSGLLLLRP